MRLTLRTLLAWLDDTLSPAEVREIGKQVAESPFAKELVERIHRVTRQRRLTVPPWTGADGVDPNLVAGYLDNELDPDQVAEFERKCLTSDVHLAEVASIHQILSLIGQKAKVPTEARLRMYQLIKGREAIRPKRPTPTPGVDNEPLTEPIQPWVTPSMADRPWVERYGPMAAVVGLIVLLAFAAWSTLTPPEAPSNTGPLANAGGALANRAAVAPGAPKAKGKAEANANAQANRADQPPGAQGAAMDGLVALGLSPEDLASIQSSAPATKTAPAPAADRVGSAPAPEGSETAKAPEPPKPPGADIPPGSAGLARKVDGLLLRFHPERRDWERITEGAPLVDQDRLLNLAPFRTTLEVGQANADLAGETEVWVRATPKSQAARLTLAQGRLVLHGTTPPLPFEVQSAGRTITVTPPPGVAVGVERVNRRTSGEPTAAAPETRVYIPEGPVTVAAEGGEATIKSAGAITVGAEGKPVESTHAVPSWVTESAPPPFDQKIGEQFLTFFRPDRPIVSSLVEALEVEQKDVCRLAISALRAVGDISYIVPLLNRRGDPNAPTARRAAITALRAHLAESPGAAKDLRPQLQRVLGDEAAAVSEKLLIGYTAKEAGDEATYAKLVQLLGTPDPAQVGIRALALDNLRQLTGRDDLEYDPEKPEDSPGLKAWRDLLRNGDLKPPAAAPTRGQ